jgi:hypothetical protein
VIFVGVDSYLDGAADGLPDFLDPLDVFFDVGAADAKF